MTEPQKARLGVGREIYDADFYDSLNRFGHDLPFYLNLARAARGPVLELCCGTGRLTIPIAKAGIDITGLDYTPSMVARARDKARAQGLSVRFVRGDMRRARVGGRRIASRLDMRCFYPLEMDALLRYNGFKVLRKYGSFDRKPFRSESPKQIYLCRAAG